MSISTVESDVDFTKLKVAELKQELKRRGLSVDGKKNELLERLQTSIGDAALLDDAHDDLLDDAELSDEEVLDDSAIDTPPPEPVKTSPLKRPIEDEEKRHPKKIILNRKTTEAPDPLLEPAQSEIAQAVDLPKPAAVEKPTLHVLTEDERRIKRAARFGVGAVNNPEQKTGGTNVDVAKPKLGTAPTSAAAIDLLKKRAERFGTIAPALEKVKIEEKKLERLKRFGEGQLQTSTVTIGGDKKAQRAARFAS